MIAHGSGLRSWSVEGACESCCEPCTSSLACEPTRMAILDHLCHTPCLRHNHWQARAHRFNADIRKIFPARWHHSHARSGHELRQRATLLGTTEMKAMPH